MNIVSAEILTTGFCPFNCSYCYIPKTKEMKSLHQEIIRQLEDGTYLNVLAKTYGRDLEYLGFWGTEPTLTLPIIGKQLPTIIKRFPKLKEINFSTSMMTSPNILYDFIERASRIGKRFTLKIQISLDGPKYITDVNRMEGASKKIPKNLFTLLEKLQALDLKALGIEFRWKATLSIENIRMLVRHPSKIDEYLKFFRGLNTRFDQINKSKAITMRKGSFTPTLVVPGKYTSDDGKVFGAFIKLLRSKGCRSTYHYRLLKIIRASHELHKRRVFSCSGGDSNFGIEKQIHICHRTFYYNKEKYMNSILKSRKYENWDVSNFEKGTIDYITRSFIVDPTVDSERIRFLYVLRNYHDFWRCQVSYIQAMMKELALANQVDKDYLLNEELTTLFALFINSALSCPMENLLNTSSIHVQTISLLRMFGNGAFREILRGVYSDLCRRE